VVSEVVQAAKRGRQDYNWFMTHCLDVNPEHLWDGMVKVNNSVRDNEKTTVPAGHGVSKTYDAARLALTFLSCHYPSSVITTAPTGTQVKNLLWREIREAHANARIPIGGRITTTMLDMQPETGVKWFAIGISTKPDTVTKEATKFQGYHNDYVLVIFDEAMGVLSEIWRAAMHIGAPFKRFLAIGNVTSSYGDFADTLDDPTYNTIRISVKDTPNFKTGRLIIPGVYGREYEREIRLKYGENSDEYRVRVEGRKSRKGVEGAYYGNVMSELEKMGRITDVDFDRSKPVYTVQDPGYTTAIWLFQPRGLDIAFPMCLEDSGLGIEQWAHLLEETAQQHGIRYGGHYAPVDVDSNAYRAVAGKSLLEHYAENHIRITPLEPEGRINDGITRTTKFLHRCWFDRNNCTRGIKALKTYCEKKDLAKSTEENPVFAGYPEKSWPRHLADGMRYASKAVKMLPTRDEETQRQELQALAAKHRRPQ
jgi:hypothetical protein